ncbi:MAG TPA: porin [Roseateles sp.]
MKTRAWVAGLGAMAMAMADVHAQQAATLQLFGVMDIGVQQLRGDGAGKRRLVTSDGNASSRLGLRGSEDLGDGLKVGFWLESAVTVDDGGSGTISTNNKDSVGGGLTWGRRATLQLSGDWGELRLGRDYVPTFLNLTLSMHPFGPNGVASSGLLFYPVPAHGTTPRTNARASNSIGYFLPSNLGGAYGQVMLALGEQGAGPTHRDGNLHGIRIGWRNEDFNASAATSLTRYATGDYRQSNVGLSWQWGAVRLMGLWGENRVGTTKTMVSMLGARWRVVPQGEFRLACTRLKASGAANDASHLAVGYVHDLSKRSALYGNAARISNKDHGQRFHVGLATTTPGGSSSGAEVGIRHSF